MKSVSINEREMDRQNIIGFKVGGMRNGGFWAGNGLEVVIPVSALLGDH
jgi:hypothetical protein